MGIFSAIMDKFRRLGDSDSSREPSGTQTAATDPKQPQSDTDGARRLQNVNIDAVLSHLATQKGGGGNYRQSIVDLLKLLDLDSSLAARKELAEELNVRVGADGSAEQNTALHQAVMRKVAENGGRVPESMRN